MNDADHVPLLEIYCEISSIRQEGYPAQYNCVSKNLSRSSSYDIFENTPMQHRYNNKKQIWKNAW